MVKTAIERIEIVTVCILINTKPIVTHILKTTISSSEIHFITESLTSHLATIPNLMEICCNKREYNMVFFRLRIEKKNKTVYV